MGAAALARVAWLVARSPWPVQRIRRVLVPVLAFCTLLAVTATVTSLVALHREQQRLDARAAVVSANPGGTLLDLRSDAWHARQYPVVWLEVQADGATPPGLPSRPSPGWYLSPALAEARHHAAALRSRFPEVSVIGHTGVVNHAELLAYRVVAPGTALGPSAVRVGRFGARPGDGVLSLGERTEYGVPQMVVVAAGLIGVPVTVALSVMVGSAAGLRRHRLGILDALGIRARQRAFLTVVETLALALPGSAGALLLWLLVAPHLTSVPLVGRPVDGRDLQAPPVVALTAASQLLVVVGLAAASSAVGRWRGPRPLRQPDRPSALRVVPLVVGALLLGYAQTRYGRAATSTMLVGTAILGLAMPAAYPVVVRAIGRRFQRSTNPAVLLAAGRLAHDPTGAVRHMLGLAALLVIAPSALTWLHAVDVTDPPPPRDATAVAYVVTGVDGPWIDRAAAHVGGQVVRVVPLSRPPAGRAPTLPIHARCAALGDVLGARACRAGTTTLTTAAAHRLQQVIGLPFPPRLAAGGASDPAVRYVVAPRGADVENRLRASLLRAPAAVYPSTPRTSSLSDAHRSSPGSSPAWSSSPGSSRSA